MKNLKNLTLNLLVASSCLCGCSNPKIEIKDCPIGHDTEFGQVKIMMDIVEFDKLGFKLGDSVNISFSNGYKINDIPYYSGYYCKTYDLLMVKYQGYDTIRIAFSNGYDVFEHYSLTKNDTISVELNKRGKYIEIENTLGLIYSDDISEYNSKEEFANFRPINMGNLKENMFYRGASPCDDQHNRALACSELCADVGIKYFLDLADTQAKLVNFYNQNLGNTYWRNIFDQNGVTPLGLNPNARSEYYKGQVKIMVEEMLKKTDDGPFYIHCTEGKDRTGFICILLEALAHSNPTDILNDYMESYKNYFSVTKATNPKAYNAFLNVRYNDLLSILTDKAPNEITSEDLFTGGKSYLSSCGIDEENINNLISYISK